MIYLDGLIGTAWAQMFRRFLFVGNGRYAMAIILTGIWIRPEEPFEKAAQTARRQLRVNPKDILSIYPVKSSIDARHPDKIRIVYSVGVELTCDEEAVLQRANLSNAFLRRDSALELSFGTEPMTHRPVVAGFGPAGMRPFCCRSRATGRWYWSGGWMWMPASGQWKDFGSPVHWM